MQSHPATAGLSVLASLLALALSPALQLLAVDLLINSFPWLPGPHAGATPFMPVLPRNTRRDSVSFLKKTFD